MFKKGVDESERKASKRKQSSHTRAKLLQTALKLSLRWIALSQSKYDNNSLVNIKLVSLWKNSGKRRFVHETIEWDFEWIFAVAATFVLVVAVVGYAYDDSRVEWRWKPIAKEFLNINQKRNDFRLQKKTNKRRKNRETLLPKPEMLTKGKPTQAHPLNRTCTKANTPQFFLAAKLRKHCVEDR